jgi:ABC-type amino acid transport system permease subunit
MLDSFYTAFIEEQRYLLYLDGLKMTILVSVIAIIIGVVLGTLLALMRLTAEQKGKSTLLSKIAYVYIVILKGQSGLLVGSLTFGLNSAAYVAEIIRAGIQAVDQGQMEGGRSLGLSYVQTMKDIIQRLSRYYNVSITCTPEVAQKCTMGKLILFDDIEQVMKTFSLLYDVQCTIEAGSIKIE